MHTPPPPQNENTGVVHPLPPYFPLAVPYLPVAVGAVHPLSPYLPLAVGTVHPLLPYLPEAVGAVHP